MPGNNPVKLLVKLPVAAPSDVLLSEIVGVAPVLQQTPRAIMVRPLSSVILPPLIAEIFVIPFTADVVIKGSSFYLILFATIRNKLKRIQW